MGFEPALGASATVKTPPVAMVTEVLPAGTESPEAVVKAGQLMRTVPVAVVPSAR
jgi:hypothetical protein